MDDLFINLNTEFTNNSLITHYKLDNGKIWSINDAKYVENIPDNAIIGPCLDEQGNSSIEGLVGCLDFYNYDKGELKTDAEYAMESRSKRNQLLAETDYLVMPDYPLTNDKHEAVLTYRQALRDIPEQSGFPREIIWPEKNF